MNTTTSTSPGTNIIGNIGLFHTCYELSSRGFNVVPTSRNTKAVDVIVGSGDFAKRVTVQVKTTTIQMGIPFAKVKYPTIKDVLKFTRLADFWVYVLLDTNIPNYPIKEVFVWRGDDKKLVREMTNYWWFDMWGKTKTIPDAVKLKWKQQKDDAGWQLIVEALKQ